MNVMIAILKTVGYADCLNLFAWKFARCFGVGGKCVDYSARLKNFVSAPYFTGLFWVALTHFMLASRLLKQKMKK